MSISALRTEVGERLRAFAWDQWSQLGVLAPTDRRDRWAIDPEALLLFTFEVGRDDPRLFDEVLDWLVVNERLVSVQRLRNLARDDADRALVEATLGWVGRSRPRARLSARPTPGRPGRDGAEALFRATRVPTRQPDKAFLAHGFLKPRVEASGNSRPPDPTLPVSFAFLLRLLLGVGARAEAMRVLLGADTPRLTAQTIAESAGYTKRNVHEALASLSRAGVLEVIVRGNEQRFSAHRERWATLLGTEAGELPGHRDWPALLYALRRIARWLADASNERHSDYMRASEARRLVDEIGPELQSAEVAVVDRGRRGADYWEDFVETVRGALNGLATGSTAHASTTIASSSGSR